MCIITNEDYDYFVLAKTLEGAKKYIADLEDLPTVLARKSPYKANTYVVEGDTYCYFIINADTFVD